MFVLLINCVIKTVIVKEQKDKYDFILSFVACKTLDNICKQNKGTSTTISKPLVPQSNRLCTDYKPTDS